MINKKELCTILSIIFCLVGIAQLSAKETTIPIKLSGVVLSDNSETPTPTVELSTRIKLKNDATLKKLLNYIGEEVSINATLVIESPEKFQIQVNDFNVIYPVQENQQDTQNINQNQEYEDIEYQDEPDE